MAARSEPSAKKGKRSMSRTKPNVPALAPDDALEMLASAINYCRTAGLQVSAGNHAGALVLAIRGAQLDRANGRVKFMPSTDVASTADVPAQSARETAEAGLPA